MKAGWIVFIVLVVIFVLVVLILLAPTFNYIIRETRKNNRFSHLHKKFTQEERYEALGETFEFLKEAKLFETVDVVLDWGTLLGIVRENDFIKHDYDVDMWVSVDDIGKVKDLLSTNQKAQERFVVEVTCPNKWLGAHDQVTVIDTKTGVHADIDTRVKKSGFLCRGYYPRILHNIQVSIPYSHRKVHVDMVYPLKEQEFRGAKVHLPNNAEEMLELYYDDWKTPQVYRE